MSLSTSVSLSTSMASTSLPSTAMVSYMGSPSANGASSSSSSRAMIVASRALASTPASPPTPPLVWEECSDREKVVRLERKALSFEPSRRLLSAANATCGYMDGKWKVRLVPSSEEARGVCYHDVRVIEITGVDSEDEVFRIFIFELENAVRTKAYQALDETISEDVRRGIPNKFGRESFMFFKEFIEHGSVESGLTPISIHCVLVG